MTTGAEEFGGPVAVKAKYPGTGDNSHDGYVIFDPGQYAERQGLLLLNHVIYTGWTSHCDSRPYTGWLIGYNESTLAQTSVLNLTPNGNEGSIWQGGAGIASDGQNLFFLDANGTFDTTLNKHGFPSKGDYGNGFLKVSTTNNKLRVADYFNMFDTVQESENDEDLGSGGALVLPPMKDAKGKTRHLAIGAGKDQNIYVVDRNNMGKFNPNNDDAIYQEIDGVLGGGEWATSAYFKGNVYFGPVGNNLLQFQFSKARLSTSPRSKSAAIVSLIRAPRRVFPPMARATASFGRSSTVIRTTCCTPTMPRTWRTSSTTRIRREISEINSEPPATSGHR